MQAAVAEDESALQEEFTGERQLSFDLDVEEERTVKLEVSIGASDYTSAEGLEACIQLADQAMYRQKHARKSPYEGFPAVRISAPVAAQTGDY